MALLILVIKAAKHIQQPKPSNEHEANSQSPLLILLPLIPLTAMAFPASSKEHFPDSDLMTD